ncbi:MAG: hypothetical protein IT424_02710 [Pirellulales bacterium]|nr:hypothetical protein [Pirellulales bacterium]
MNRAVFALAVAMLAVDQGAAQNTSSVYTKTTLNSYQLRNSVAGFTSDRIRNTVVRRSIPQYSFSNVNRGLLQGVTGNTPSRPVKPFSNVQRGTNVTPYIGLLSENPFNSSVTNYYSLVRPQIEQQRTNERIQQQNLAIQRRLNDIAAQAPYDPSGSEQLAPTGHVAVYQNFGGYYPQAAPTAGQRRR